MCLEMNPFNLDFTDPENRFVVVQQARSQCGFPARHYEVVDRGQLPNGAEHVLGRFEEHKLACRYAHEVKTHAYQAWAGTWLGEGI